MKYRIAEIICIAAAVLFIVFSLSINAETSKTAEEISAEICQSLDTSALIKRDSKLFRKNFNISPEEIDGFVYYSSDNIMDVSEVLVIKLNSSSDRSDIIGTLEKYADSRYNIFAAYAPEQGEMLKNRVLKKSGNVIFMYIGKNSSAAQDAFNKAV